MITTLNLFFVGAAALCQAQEATPAQRAFDQFKAMAGKWAGAADDGRKIVNQWQVIAGGSVVMYESEFDGHAGEKMVTMFHMDNGRLLLTHYCVARNQPRLQATEFSSDGKRVVFTFLDGTNLKNRDQGHMDKVVWEFPDAETRMSHWTWYQDGKESWMEKFTMKRVREGVVVTSTGSPLCCPK
jgi:hypothetical protein